MNDINSFRNTEFRLDGDRILRIHHWEYGDGESEEIKEMAFERPEYNPNDDRDDDALRYWVENASFVIQAANKYFAMLDACEAALVEFDRLTGDTGFEPNRFRERIAVLHKLVAAVES